jgi:hypothetical protein
MAILGSSSPGEQSETGKSIEALFARIRSARSGLTIRVHKSMSRKTLACFVRKRTALREAHILLIYGHVRLKTPLWGRRKIARVSARLRKP